MEITAGPALRRQCASTALAQTPRPIAVAEVIEFVGYRVNPTSPASSAPAGFGDSRFVRCPT